MSKRKLILKPATIENCKAGSIVFDPRVGLGVIQCIEDNSYRGYPIDVKHNDGESDSYTTNGIWDAGKPTPSLFLVPDGINLKDYKTISLEFNIKNYATD